MATNKKKKLYYAQVRIVVDTNYPVRAESLADAVELAKEIKLLDYVDIHGDYIDGDSKVMGVTEDYSSCDLK